MLAFRKPRVHNLSLAERKSLAASHGFRLVLVRSSGAHMAMSTGTLMESGDLCESIYSMGSAFASRVDARHAWPQIPVRNRVTNSS